MSLCSHFTSLKPQKLANMIKKSVFKCTNPQHEDTQYNLCLHCGQTKCNNTVEPNSKRNCFQIHMEHNNKHVLALKIKDCFVYCYRCQVEIQGVIEEMEEQGIGGSKIEKARELYDKIRQMAIKNLPQVYSSQKNPKTSKGNNNSKIATKQGSNIKKEGQLQPKSNNNEFPQLRTFGLSNIGNTCYFNSLLQCLFSLPEIHTLYSRLQLKDDLNRTFYKFLLNSEKVFCPKNLFSIIAQKFKFLKSMDQQDAYQLYVLLIDCLIQSSVNKGQNISFREKVQQSIGRIFGFYCASRLECLQCGKISWNKDFNLGLTVPISKPICRKIQIPFGEQISYQEIGQHGLSYPVLESSNNFLDNFFLGEILTKSNSFKCQKCSQSKATKKFYLIQPPQILTINFKKFNNSGKKIDSYISIPSQIELAPHCLRKGQFTYQLHAGIVHSGSSRGGHYVAYTRRVNNKWYYFSDSNVKPASQNSLRDNSPYVLMYRKKIYEFEDNNLEKIEEVQKVSQSKFHAVRKQQQKQYKQLTQEPEQNQD